MLNLKSLELFVLVSLMSSACAFSQTMHRQVAITIDDLPDADGYLCNEHETITTTKRLLDPIRAAKVPVVGFVVGARCGNLNPKQRRGLLKMWLDAGAELGNHTWSHPDLNRVPLEEYEKQILAMDDNFHRTNSPSRFRYFRAPYLHNGATPETRKKLQSFLTEHGYQEAPVTFDNNDCRFAAAYSRALKKGDAVLAKLIEEAYTPYMESIVAFFEKRSVEVLGRECPQVLLLHASRLNAEMMPRLLHLFRERGYTFVSLEQAISDEAYRLPDTYVGEKGLSWIHRWGLTNGKPIQMEPKEPDWVRRAN
jgi:peptidoglycan/xylan/chitin deacetylase (PgdA/CDA1 family)